MPDNDEIILEDAKEAAFALDKAYRRAIQAADLANVTALKPQVENAYNQYGQARLKLLEKGVLATDDDVAEMRRIRAEIDQAATTQALIAGAIKLGLMLAKYT